MGGVGAKLGFMVHALTENRSELVVDARVTHATGTAKPEAALAMVKEIAGGHLVTLGAERGYDTADSAAELVDNRATLHVAQNDTNRRSAIDDRTTRHRKYVVSQRNRKRIEDLLAWRKKSVGLEKPTTEGLSGSDGCSPGSPLPTSRSGYQSSLRAKRNTSLRTVRKSATC